MILFGSYARGDMTPDRDVDRLVVMPIAGSRRHVATETERALADRMLPLDLILVAPKEFDTDRDVLGNIVDPAAREAKVLDERAGGRDPRT